MSDRCTEPGLMPLSVGLHRLLGNIQPIMGLDDMPLKQALGHILAEPLYSDIDVPPFRNSYMDGYALRAADSQTESSFDVIGTSWAGKPFVGEISRNQCIRIFTGAKVPDSADCVVMQEHVDRHDNIIGLKNPVQVNDNVRFPGDDLKKGQILFEPGRRLQPADLGVIASAGHSTVKVHRIPRVAFFSTGDELMPADAPLGDGQIHDSNRYLLFGLLTDLGVTCTDLGVIPDRAEAVEAALLNAATDHDVIISSGGASVGDADFIVGSIQKLGQINFWKLAMKPGKPLVAGKIQGAHFFGLPGNPVSVMVNFCQVVRPALLKLMGAIDLFPIRVPARLTQSIQKQPGRMEFQRGLTTLRPDGLWVEPTGNQGSHILSSVSRADCFIILEQDNDGMASGDTVLIEFFQGPMHKG